jgi:hypothetical protein
MLAVIVKRHQTNPVQKIMAKDNVWNTIPLEDYELHMQHDYLDFTSIGVET